MSIGIYQVFNFDGSLSFYDFINFCKRDMSRSECFDAYYGLIPV